MQCAEVWNDSKPSNAIFLIFATNKLSPFSLTLFMFPFCNSVLGKLHIRTYCVWVKLHWYNTQEWLSKYVIIVKNTIVEIIVTVPRVGVINILRPRWSRVSMFSSLRSNMTESVPGRLKAHLLRVYIQECAKITLHDSAELALFGVIFWQLFEPTLCIIHWCIFLHDRCSWHLIIFLSIVHWIPWHSSHS